MKSNDILTNSAFDCRTPGDLLFEIALFLETRLDILNFCLAVGSNSFVSKLL